MVFILTYLKAARFHLAGKNPPRPLCNDSLQCPPLAVDRASPTRRVIWSTPSFQQQICERISNISHFYSCPRAGTFESHLCFFSSIPAVSLTRQQDLAGRLARQACPAGLPSRLPLQAGRLAQRAYPGGYLCRPGGFLSRLTQQACPAGNPCRPAGKRTGFFLKTSSARLLPQDFLFKTSSSRSPEGRLSPLQALPCCCLQT